MRLPDSVILACKLAGVSVYFATREHVKYLNGLRMSDEPCNYGGFYWLRTDKNGKVTDTDQEGPFKSQSAALRDAFMKLQLRRVEVRKERKEEV